MGRSTGSRLQLSTMPASTGLSREAVRFARRLRHPKCSTTTSTTTPRLASSLHISALRTTRIPLNTPHLQHHLIVPCSSHQQRPPHFLRIIPLAASRAAHWSDCSGLATANDHPPPLPQLATYNAIGDSISSLFNSSIQLRVLQISTVMR